MEYISHSVKETAQIAKQIAKELKGGDCLGLIGNLGAGKTTFAKALGKALGVKQTMTSPTFVLMKVYPINSEIKFLCHIDAYRLGSIEDLMAMGAQDFIGNSDTVTIIEWADRVTKVLPKNTSYINISQDEASRTITIN